MIRHTSTLRRLRLIAGLLVLAGCAGAAPIIDIFPSIGPDIDAASFAAYSQNALYAIQNNLNSYGTPGTPSYYQQVGSFSSFDVVSSYNAFHSWLGQPSPAGAYANEYGNMLYWGVRISGNGEQFSLRNVSYADSFFGDTASINLGWEIGYVNRAIGISFGPNRVPGGGDDVIINMGAAGSAATGQMVDVLYFSGIGLAFTVDDPAALNYYLNEIRNAGYPFARATYIVNTRSGVTFGSGEVLMSDAVPEPATFGFVGGGLLALAYAARRWTR